MKTHTLELRLTRKYTLNRILTEHWGKRRHEKMMYHKIVTAYLMNNKIDAENLISAYPVIVHYHFKTKGRQLDWTNLAGMTKLIEDTLTERKVFKNDSPKYISHGILSSERITDGHEKVIVTIYEPEDEEEIKIAVKP